MIEVDRTRCLEGWPSREPCNYTGGCYCVRKIGHGGRCHCVCGSTHTTVEPHFTLHEDGTITNRATGERGLLGEVDLRHSDLTPE